MYMYEYVFIFHRRRSFFLYFFHSTARLRALRGAAHWPTRGRVAIPPLNKHTPSNGCKSVFHSRKSFLLSQPRGAGHTRTCPAFLLSGQDGAAVARAAGRRERAAAHLPEVGLGRGCLGAVEGLPRVGSLQPGAAVGGGPHGLILLD